MVLSAIVVLHKSDKTNAVKDMKESSVTYKVAHNPLVRFKWPGSAQDRPQGGLP